MASSQQPEMEKLVAYFKAHYVRPDDEKRQEQALWDNAKTYDDILQLNRKYLVRQIHLTPYVPHQLEHETDHLVLGLLRLHDYGIFTFDSQPCRAEDPFLVECPCKDCATEAKAIEKDHPFVERFRPYVQFLLPREDPRISTEDIKKFCKELWSDDKMYTTIVKPLSYDGDIKIQLSTNMPGGDQPTRAKQYGSTQKEAYAGKMHQSFNFGPENIKIFKNLKTKAKIFQKMKPILVKVLAKSWSQQDLQSLVQKAAERAGIEPQFVMQPDEKSVDEDAMKRDKHFRSFMDNNNRACICFMDRAFAITILAETLKKNISPTSDFAKLKIHHILRLTKLAMGKHIEGTIKTHYCGGIVHHGMGNVSAECVEDLLLSEKVHATSASTGSGD